MNTVKISKDLLRYAYEVVSSYDLVGTGGKPHPEVERYHYNKIQEMERILNIPIDERVNYQG